MAESEVYKNEEKHSLKAVNLGLEDDRWEVMHLDLEENKNNKCPKLMWSSFGLLDLPEEIFEFTWLENLNLSYNKLTSLSKKIGQLTNLKSLDLSFNELTELPEEIFNLEHLSYLRLSANRLTAFPKGIGRVTNPEPYDLAPIN